jgi:putative photosynthetic complex assembly protein 2
MSPFVLPVLFTLFVWWFSTGVILYLDGFPRRTYRWSMAGATAVLAGALYGLLATRSDTSVSGAYFAFTCSLLVWGWVEMSFLMGFVTGPRETPCPAGSRGWRRAGYALQTIIYHEFALLGAGAAVLVATLGGTNPVGWWTYAILWALRQSAKLNVFLGVRNLSEEFLPPHLRYLQTYFRRRPMNALFPFAVTAATIVAALVWKQAFAADTEFDATALAFAGTLLALGIVEHGFMVMPLPSTALWNWSLRSRARPGAEASPKLAVLVANKADLN